MADALDLLQPCPICGKTMLITLNGLVCLKCDYWFCSEDDETLVHTCERYNAEFETIRADLEKE